MTDDEPQEQLRPRRHARLGGPARQCLAGHALEQPPVVEGPVDHHATPVSLASGSRRFSALMVLTE